MCVCVCRSFIKKACSDSGECRGLCECDDKLSVNYLRHEIVRETRTSYTTGSDCAQMFTDSELHKHPLQSDPDSLCALKGLSGGESGGGPQGAHVKNRIPTSVLGTESLVFHDGESKWQ